MRVLEPLTDRCGLADGDAPDFEHGHAIGGVQLSKPVRAMARVDLQQLDRDALLGEGDASFG